MARVDWERANLRERGWRAGTDSERPEIPRSLGCDHKWGPWTKPQFDSRWHRHCAKCPVASPDVVYDDHHTNLVLMFYTAVSSWGRASSPAPAIRRMRALVRDSADM